MPRRMQNPDDRFWAKVDKDGPIPLLHPELGRCWQWQGGTFAKGYGQFSCKREGRWTPIGAHRYSFLCHGGEFEPGKQLHHRCENTACVNPAHLEQVTPIENIHEITHRNPRSVINYGKGIKHPQGSTAFTLQLSNPTLEALRTLAEERGWSVSAVANRLLAESLQLDPRANEQERVA